MHRAIHFEIHSTDPEKALVWRDEDGESLLSPGAERPHQGDVWAVISSHLNLLLYSGASEGGRCQALGIPRKAKSILSLELWLWQTTFAIS